MPQTPINHHAHKNRSKPPSAGLCQPRRPQETLLYKLVQENLETFLALHREACPQSKTFGFEDGFARDRAALDRLTRYCPPISSGRLGRLNDQTVASDYLLQSTIDFGCEKRKAKVRKRKSREVFGVPVEANLLDLACQPEPVISECHDVAPTAGGMFGDVPVVIQEHYPKRRNSRNIQVMACTGPQATSIKFDWVSGELLSISFDPGSFSLPDEMRVGYRAVLRELARKYGNPNLPLVPLRFDITY